MQFDFSEEQKALRDEVRRFLSKACPMSVVREVADGAAPYHEGLWKKMAEAGFLAAAIPEEYGGGGAGYLELCVVAEECGRTLAPLPTVTSVYQATELLLASGSDAQKKEWLPRLANGTAIGTVAVAEGDAKVTNGKLTGTKWPAADGTFAIVEAEGALYLASLEGVTRRPLKTIDPTRKHVALEFKDTPVEPLKGDLVAVRDRAAVLTAFEQIGGAQAALMMARDYALNRYAFGRPIGSFQALKHMLADMYVATELARSNTYYGAWALATNSPKLPYAAASARVAATRGYQLASTNNIQIHGGMGFTWEFDCHLYYRRSNYLALALGGPSHWEKRLVDNLEAA